MKFIIFFLLLLGGTLLGGLYGSLHNQLSYTVAPEFFTKVRFEQFGMSLTSGRIGAAIIGWKNTWKTGLGLSLVLCLVGLIHPDYK